MMHVMLADCPCCGNILSKPFYEVGPVPVHSCLMLTSPHEALRFPSEHVRLAFCSTCGFVCNTVFDPRWSAYAPNYEDQQSFSPTFNAFAKSLADRLITQHDLRGKHVVEIGCSKGDFLHLLCNTGRVHATGIDPSIVKDRIPPPHHGQLNLIAEYYGPQHLDLPADLICCRHTLEHIQPVHATLSLIHEHACKTQGATVCIEVPDAQRIWKTGAFEDVYYEHCSYFTAGSLAAAVRRAGMAVTDLRQEYDAQYLVLEASTDPQQNRYFEIEETPEQVKQDIFQFSDRVRRQKNAWHHFWGARKNSLNCVWGSGSKCVSFMKTLGNSAPIDRIVDINPYRTGRYAPGLPIPIHHPESVRATAPETVVVMNPIYMDEITQFCETLARKPNIVPIDVFRNDL